MRKQIFSLTVLVVLVSFILVSCKKETSLNTQQVEPSAYNATISIAKESKKVYVSISQWFYTTDAVELTSIRRRQDN